MPAKKKSAAKKTAKKKVVATHTHAGATRKNIPSAEMQPVVGEDVKTPIQVAYERRNPDLDPQLVWRGKDDEPLEVPAPPLYIQEKVHPKHLIDDLVASSQWLVASGKAQATSHQSQFTDLFADFNGLPDNAKSADFYRHDGHWQNRMILGDSLQVMASLAEREGLRCKVQCIYLDPPYGIKFNSNFQWSTTSRDVKDGKADHISREPEQVKAFRDTWRDGIHSYLTYLRDRLLTARDLLTDSGSIFVQIGDENVHRVRALMDEVFGEDNHLATINYVTTSGFPSKTLTRTGDMILWYSKAEDGSKYRQLFETKGIGDSSSSEYKWLKLKDGSIRPMSKEEHSGLSSIPEGSRRWRYGPLTSSGASEKGTVDFKFQGNTYRPTDSNHWKVTLDGLDRLNKGGFLISRKNSLAYYLFADNYPVKPITDYWLDTKWGFDAGDKSYVVQTNVKVVEKCIQMATDPGDLVLDPTCGSGTTAYVAEQWGRRWITIDTSRVALALARARIMGARYPYYLLADSREGQIKEAELTRTAPRDTPTHGHLSHGFVYERVPHITLKSIANNAEIDVIWEDYEKRLAPLRDELSVACGLGKTLEEWEIPREAPSHWPQTTQPLLTDFWQERIARQKEIDASIAAKADSEYLYDKPYEDKSKVRVAGPFTVESASPHRTLHVDENDEIIDTWKSINEDPTEFKIQDFTTVILENLKTAGVQQAHKDDRLTFTAITPFPGKGHVCAEATYTEGDSEDAPTKRAAIFIGPEFGTVSRPDLVEAAREAGDLNADVLIACAFNYDAHSSEFERLGKVPVLKARMNADLHMADDLKNTGKGNLFVIFGEPDVDVTCDLWLMTRGGRFVASYEHVKELSGLGSLEEVNRLGGEDLSSLKKLSAGRALRIDQSGPEGGGVGTVEHRGGSGPDGNRGIPSGSERGQRIIGGGGDPGDRRESSRDAAIDGDGGAAGVLGGNQPDAGRPEAVTGGPSRKSLATSHEALAPLTPSDFPLSLTTSHFTRVTILGIDVFKPSTGEVVSSGPEGIACWFIDTDYNEESFFVRHAYFLGQQDPYKSLKTTLKAQIDEEAWATLNSDVSRPFPKPSTGRIAVKVINHLGDEVMKVFSING